jgi:hypothetical protein
MSRRALIPGVTGHLVQMMVEADCARVEKTVTV